MRSRHLVALVLAAFGCTTGGDIRRISLSSDMAPGDVAHYRALAGEGTESRKIEDATVVFPVVFVPLFVRAREASADPPVDGRRPFHFEDTRAILLYLLTLHGTANFDGDGRVVSCWGGVDILFGAISSSTGHARREDGSAAPTSSFSLLWGLFATRRTPAGRSYTLLWFPIVGD